MNNEKAATWKVFRIAELMEKVAGEQPRIYEFLHERSMSCVVYRLPAGSKDLQAPHPEDEIYIVLEGRAKLKIGEKIHEITEGCVLYVRATSAHSFFDIEEDLTVLAVFGPQV